MSRLHTITEGEATGKTALLFSAIKSDQQVVETIGVVSAILFTNMVNRVNDTVINFPKVN